MTSAISFCRSAVHGVFGHFGGPNLPRATHRSHRSPAHPTRSKMQGTRCKTFHGVAAAAGGIEIVPSCSSLCPSVSVVLSGGRGICVIRGQSPICAHLRYLRFACLFFRLCPLWELPGGGPSCPQAPTPVVGGRPLRSAETPPVPATRRHETPSPEPRPR